MSFDFLRFVYLFKICLELLN